MSPVEPARNRWRTTLVCFLLLTAAAAWPGCQCGRLEIGETNRLVEGNYQGLWGFPWGDGQKYVIAEKLDADGGTTDTYTVVRIADGRSCDIPIHSPQWFWWLDEHLFVIEDIDWNSWTGRLSYLPLPCGPAQRLLDNVFLALWTDSTQGLIYLVSDVNPQNGRGTLRRIKWPEDSIQTVRENVPSWTLRFDWPEPRALFIDAGELVALRLTGEEEGRVGTGVTYFVSSGNGEVLFEQQPALFRARTNGTGLQQLSENACSPLYSNGRIYHFEPCSGATREIVVRDGETGNEIGRFGSGVGRFRTGPSDWLSWIQGQAESSGPGTIWVRPPDGEPRMISESANPNWIILGDEKVVIFSRLSGPAEAQLIAYDLAQSKESILAERIESGLAIAQSPWSKHYAVVTDLVASEPVDGGVSERLGRLKLIHPTNGERHVIAENVPVRGYRFSWQAPALGYLRDFDPVSKSGQFQVLSMIDESRFDVDTGVREFAEVFAPRRGVSYVIREPGREGIYFVEAILELF